MWTVDPEKYDPSDAIGARGGILFECKPTPPMIAIDRECNLWVPQDKSDGIIKIDLSRPGQERVRPPAHACYRHACALTPAPMPCARRSRSRCRTPAETIACSRSPAPPS